MIRVLLVLLGVLIAVLAFVLERPLLYAAAGVALATALALAARRLLRRRRAQQGPGHSSEEREEPMENLGIMDVRPQARTGDGTGGSARGEGDDSSSEAPSRDAPSRDSRPHPPTRETSADRRREDGSGRGAEQAGVEEGPPEAPETPETHPATMTEDGETSGGEEDVAPTADSETPSPNGSVESAPASSESEPATTESERRGVTMTPIESDPVLVPYVESLRAALNAQSVCILVQEDVLLDYEIRAIASTVPDVQQTGSFSTQEPLLTATMTQQPVTIRPLDGEGAVEEFLKYYRSPVPVDHIALAPVRRPNEPSTCFLLADAAESTNLDTTEARTLLEHFAETLGLILDADHSETASTTSTQADSLSNTAQAGDGNGSMDRPATTTASEAAAAERAHAAELADETPRPRREIVAEEMDAADDENDPLALVLVHLNRAEILAEEGDDVVAAGERKLRGRLEDAAPGSRVTRFGELTYGVFFRGEVDAVEPWAIELQHEMADESGILEGGVSIGVAMRAARHDGDPEALRRDATEALRQAYESGAATIIE